jgi:hypothetical protein
VETEQGRAMMKPRRRLLRSPAEIENVSHAFQASAVLRIKLAPEVQVALILVTAEKP